MSEWVDLPSNTWPHPDVLVQPAMAKGHLTEAFCQRYEVSGRGKAHLLHDIYEVHIGLVVHAPATRNEFQPTRGRQLPHKLLRTKALLIPPFLEEGGLHIAEPPSRII